MGSAASTLLIKGTMSKSKLTRACGALLFIHILIPIGLQTYEMEWELTSSQVTSHNLTSLVPIYRPQKSCVHLTLHLCAHSTDVDFEKKNPNRDFPY